ncbi:hypothetical protein GCM10007977_024770 [Dactylosporangium sucinum]|uniref:Uncharacterized protein n=1 Tax=Dactylosporangium sucinum TaxID=1424081 RepID=A0A917TJ24_9ACTN|nr:hypothetical protein GCM10007977_024770 [Dactylosporangium sucinum]
MVSAGSTHAPRAPRSTPAARSRAPSAVSARRSATNRAVDQAPASAAASSSPRRHAHQAASTSAAIATRSATTSASSGPHRTENVLTPSSFQSNTTFLRVKLYDFPEIWGAKCPGLRRRSGAAG